MERPAARSRRPHTKSRLGCQQCKARRIKCDQVYPICGHCYRTQKPCSLRSSGPTGQGDSASPASVSASVGFDSYDALDMYLMHFFTIETAHTLTVSPAVAKVWKYAMPRRARQQPMLMHGILAIAGLHRYFSLQDDSISNEAEAQNMLSRAALHQQRGIELYRTQIAEAAKNDNRRDMEQTCLAFSAMLLTVTLGQIKAEPEPTTMDDLLGVLDHMRTIAVLLSNAGTNLDSDIGPMFGLAVNQPPNAPDLSTVVNTLQDLRQTTTDPVDTQTITTLQGILSAPITSSLEYYFMGALAITVSEDFFVALRNRRVSALRIFSEYCKALGPMYDLWFFENWTDIIQRELNSLTAINGHRPQTG